MSNDALASLVIGQGILILLALVNGVSRLVRAHTKVQVRLAVIESHLGIESRSDD